MNLNNRIQVEVAYATPKVQHILVVEIEAGSTIQSAILHSGILTIFPEIDLSKQAVGIFSKLRKLSDIVTADDRIEIYRPLAMDPKVARRMRAKTKRKK